MDTCIVVLVKDFVSAKQRLSPALGIKSRSELARRNARRAVRAALGADAGRVLVVAGGEEAAELARRWGAYVLLEPQQEGQNVAARRGIDRAMAWWGPDAGSVLLLSSDLPLVSASAISGLLSFASAQPGPVAVAVPAYGRGGTNALYLRPPGVIGLHFGDDSLARFEREARERGVGFSTYQSDAMALDLDEPADLERLRRAV